MQPSFELHLNHLILPNLVTVGKYDGKYPSLTCGTSSGKIFLHQPHEKDHSVDQIKFLAINKEITSIQSGELDTSMARDTLLIGTETTLQSYDVEKNKDIFYREIEEGLNTMIVGKVGEIDTDLVIVGGNCSIQGYDHTGEEQYWTTTGGNVSSLLLKDVEGDGINELLAGSEDYAIYIHQGETVLNEILEAQAISSMCDLDDTKYGYALTNGTIGMYDKEKRVWRMKSKNTVSSFNSYDLNGDGVKELVVGWTNGKVQIRQQKDGQVLYENQFNDSINGIVKSDYRLSGKEELIICSANGEIRGYAPIEPTQLGDQSQKSQADARTLQTLNEKKTSLLAELENYESNILKAKKKTGDSNLINPDTKVKCRLRANPKKKCVDVVFESDQNTIIKAAIITAEHLFESDSRMIYSSDPGPEICVSLHPKKDQKIAMNIKVLVGYPMGQQFHVSEMSHTMPRFSMYIPLKSEDVRKHPQGFVKFNLTERIERFVMWMKTSFNILYSHDPSKDINVFFISVRDDKIINIIVSKGEVQFKVDDMELAGALIQDISEYMKLRELESVADFPDQFEAFKLTLNHVDSYNKTRNWMTADMADHSGMVKALVIKAEDSRLLSDMGIMRSAYKELFDLNKHLIGEYIKRENNHTNLLSSLKSVNVMIQRASKLRIGQAKKRVVELCRKAVKTNNIESLFTIFKYGKEH